MRSTHRASVSKSRSVRTVRNNAGRAHILNLKGAPMRGGIRL